VFNWNSQAGFLIIWVITAVIGLGVYVGVRIWLRRRKENEPPHKKITRLAKQRGINLETASRAQIRVLVQDALKVSEIEARDLVNSVMKK